MTTILVHSHLGAFELVQFFPYGCLIFGRQSSPRFIRTPIIIVRLCHLDVIVEPNNLFLLELFDRRPKTQLSQKIPFLLLLLFLFFGWRLCCKSKYHNHVNKIHVFTKNKHLLFRIFRSMSSSAVGRIDNRRMRRAPIASFDSLISFSDCICKMFRLMRS